MKSIVESINESLNLNESTNNFVMTFMHEDPNYTYFVKNCSRNDLNRLDNYGMDYAVLQNPKGLIMFSHSDENPMLMNLEFNNENAMKKYAWDEFQKYIDYIEDGEVEDVEMDELGICLSFSDADKIKNANDLWKRIISWINDSEVDCDSMSVYGIIDINKNKTIAMGSTDIDYFDSIDDMCAELGFDDE